MCKQRIYLNFLVGAAWKQQGPGLFPALKLFGWRELGAVVLCISFLVCFIMFVLYYS